MFIVFFFFFQAEDGIRDLTVTGVQTCALPISAARGGGQARGHRVQRRGERHGPERRERGAGHRRPRRTERQHRLPLAGPRRGSNRPPHPPGLLPPQPPVRRRPPPHRGREGAPPPPAAPAPPPPARRSLRRSRSRRATASGTRPPGSPRTSPLPSATTRVRERCRGLPPRRRSAASPASPALLLIRRARATP